mmetsp:Transcript_10610/g.32459  ORF Transcript_10610/g.32459 Transcript_10610/m.32459 type:complete len:182 (+) Transcript_10610:1756-2301(+)
MSEQQVLLRGRPRSLEPQSHSRSRSRSPSPTKRELNGFSRDTKQICWQRASQVPGRDERRWRFDAVGNIVCHGLRNCNGPLCVEFDHIHPVSKGGSGHPSNCQILQARANRGKANKYPPPTVEQMKKFSDRSGRELSHEDLDAIELAVYGDVYRDGRRYRGLPRQSLPEEKSSGRRLCVIM